MSPLLPASKKDMCRSTVEAVVIISMGGNDNGNPVDGDIRPKHIRCSVWRQQLGLMLPLLLGTDKDMCRSTVFSVVIISLSANNNGIFVDCNTSSKVIHCGSVRRQQLGLISPIRCKMSPIRPITNKYVC